MDASEILDRADMERPRSPQELRTWALQKCADFGASPEGKRFARSGAELPKKFYDEILPLSIFALHEYGSRTDVLVQPHLGNDNFDAKIEIKKASGPQAIFVETTYAKDGYDESLRMEVLTREGHVWLTGPVSVSGLRGTPNRFVSVEPEAASHTETVENYLQLLEARVVAKSQVSYGKDHVLLVAVDDYRPLVQDCDWQLLDQRARSLISRLRLDFGRVAMVGMAGRLFLSYDLRVGEGKNAL